MQSPFSVPFVAGEVHYGRVQERYWGPILDSVQQLGVNLVGMYVMWQYHETREGEYDFAQLRRFLAELDRRGMKVFARPGPFYYSEWRNLGVPDHAATLPKHDPEFRRKAAHWIAAVMAELRPHLGSLVIALQADNEIDPMPHFYGEDQGFAAWLAKRYETVAAVNAAWGTGYASFDDALPWLAAQLRPCSDLHEGRPGFSRQISDACQYRYDLATEYARWAVAEFRGQGCTVPIVLNTWPGVDAQNWRDFQDECDVFGFDPYPSNECRGDFRYFRERLRLLRCVSKFPCILEFGSGVWHGVDSNYSPEHYRLVAGTAIAGGVRGWNWYMLVNRDNWYGAPINERGVIRPELGEVFAAAAAALKETADLPPPRTSFAVAWSWRYHQMAQIAKTPVDDPLFAVLHEMGVEHDYIDVDHEFDMEPADAGPVSERSSNRSSSFGGPVSDRSSWQDRTTASNDRSETGRPASDRTRSAPRLLLAAGDIAQPDRLWQYVEAGGALVFFQRLIEGCAIPDGTSHANADNIEVTLPDGTTFVTMRAVYNYRAPPGAPISARQLPWRVDEDVRRQMELATRRTYTTGYVQKRGRGTVLVLGCAPSAEAILAVHRYFGLSIPALPLTPGVHASIRGDRLFVINPGEAKAARIRLGDGTDRYVDLPRCGVVDVSTRSTPLAPA